MKRKLHTVQVAAPEASAQRALPDEVVVSLAEIAGVAKEGLLALAVGTGLSVLHKLAEHEVPEVVGTKGHHDADRAAKRHGARKLTPTEPGVLALTQTMIMFGWVVAATAASLALQSGAVWPPRSRTAPRGRRCKRWTARAAAGCLAPQA